MRILITGGTGFIGLHLVATLLQADHEIFCLVRNPREAEGKLPARVLVLPIEDVLQGRRPLPKGDALFHLAAIRHRWGVSEQEYFTANVGLTEQLLDLAVGNIEHFIYCSSISVFGWPRKLPIDESNPYNPVNLYAQSKVLCERAVLRLQQQGKINTTMIRPSITYGRGDTTGMMTKLATMIDHGIYATVGRGENRVQLVHVADLVQGFMRVLGNREAFGRAYIITASTPIRINELVARVAHEIGKPAPRLKIPFSLGWAAALGLEACYGLGWNVTGPDPIITRDRIQIMSVDRHYSIKRAEFEIGYAPRYDYVTGVKDLVQTLRQDGLLKTGKA